MIRNKYYFMKKGITMNQGIIKILNFFSRNFLEINLKISSLDNKI